MHESTGEKETQTDLGICKHTVHVISNLLQAILGYLELGEIEKAKEQTRQAAAQIHALRRKLKGK